MRQFLEEVFEAHGGVERWRGFEGVTATIVTSGSLWGLKGLVQDSDPREMSVCLHSEWASVSPFGNPDWHTEFVPNRIAIKDSSEAVLKERYDPRSAFEGHTMESPWDPLDRAYFNGYALWTYLTSPFLLAMPGFELDEIEPWKEGGGALARTTREVS